MKNTKVLEMLNKDRIEELKALLQDEIYNDALNTRSGAKQRYAAMKRYQASISDYDNKIMKYIGSDIEIHGEKYNCFIDGFTIALTQEKTGELELHNKEKHGEYFRINQMIPDLYNPDGKISYKEILAEAKQKGYKYIKKHKESHTLVKISNAHINMVLLEKAYSIIDDGEDAEIFLCEDKGKTPIILKTSIGICLILPVNINSIENQFNIFEIEIKNRKAA